jgi:hypothetical protein
MDFPLYAQRILFEVSINSTFYNLCVICYHGNIVFSVNHAFWIFGQILSKQRIQTQQCACVDYFFLAVAKYQGHAEEDNYSWMFLIELVHVFLHVVWWSF